MTDPSENVTPDAAEEHPAHPLEEMMDVYPLREASERESQKYGRHVPDSDQYFVMHRIPPRGVTDDDGNLVDITSSVISFTLCDDIRERLERGEEI